MVDVAAREVASSLLGEALLAGRGRRRAARAPATTTRAWRRTASIRPRARTAGCRIAVASDAEWQALAAMIGRLGTGRRSPLRLGSASAMPTGRNSSHRHRGGSATDAGVHRRRAAAGRRHRRPRRRGPRPRSSPTRICARARRSSRCRSRTGGTAPRSACRCGCRRARRSASTAARPQLGEHEDYVYGELLGMGAAERRELEDDKVIY